MKLLLILLSVMTFTVETKNSVHADGTWPYDMEASYACTYQKGQVRAGDTATLHIFGLDGITIEKIDVYLKSNKSSGAGILTMTMDGEEIYRLDEGTYKDWFGDYNNTEFQPIGWSGAQSGSSLDVQLVGTANSLHIEKYEITWSQNPIQTYTVTLMDGYEPIDTLHGAQVTLPSMADTDEWQFMGWTDVAFHEEWMCPDNLIPAGLYTPTEDETLWAVYRSIIPKEWYLVSDLDDGVYFYANYSVLKAMSGGVVDGVAGVADWNVADLTQMYEITFDDEGKATIRLMYVYGEEYIGFNGTKLANTPSKWNVYHEGTKTAFYTEANGRIYLLYPNYMKQIGENQFIMCTALIEVNSLENTSTVLLNGMLEGDPIYTCYPNVPFELETVAEETKKGEYIIPFGIYVIHIKDGKKQIRIR